MSSEIYLIPPSITEGHLTTKKIMVPVGRERAQIFQPIHYLLSSAILVEVGTWCICVVSTTKTIM